MSEQLVPSETKNIPSWNRIKIPTDQHWYICTNSNFLQPFQKSVHLQQLGIEDEKRQGNNVMQRQ